MSNEEFASACAALWGANWKGRAADELGVSYKTVCRWERGDFAVGANVPGELAALCIRQIRALTKLAGQLEKMK